MRPAEELETVVAYSFRDRALLERALTHSSFANEQRTGEARDNERLEFLGDAVLGLVVSDLLFRRRPRLDEGQLSRLRAFLVSAANLVRYAGQIELGEYLKLGKGEEKTGGRTKPALLVDAFEALVGAVYLDSDLDRTREVLFRLFGSQIETVADATEGVSDFKSALQEVLQARGGGVAEYRVLEAAGPDHRKLFSVEVLIGGEPISEGTGLTKKAAEQVAAMRALAALRQ